MFRWWIICRPSFSASTTSRPAADAMSVALFKARLAASGPKCKKRRRDFMQTYTVIFPVLSVDQNIFELRANKRLARVGSTIFRPISNKRPRIAINYRQVLSSRICTRPPPLAPRFFWPIRAHAAGRCFPSRYTCNANIC